jgi:hypothetical protein
MTMVRRGRRLRRDEFTAADHRPCRAGRRIHGRARRQAECWWRQNRRMRQAVWPSLIRDELRHGADRVNVGVAACRAGDRVDG